MQRTHELNGVFPLCVCCRQEILQLISPLVQVDSAGVVQETKAGHVGAATDALESSDELMYHNVYFVHGFDHGATQQAACCSVVSLSCRPPVSAQFEHVCETKQFPWKYEAGPQTCETPYDCSKCS
mmetsp:Transcript_32628/g.52540  ORF Transcript_32628/g.52540 Transcript_32628/m.52540 type:complete len:126 (+) Transcript_32628:203-580(+)